MRTTIIILAIILAALQYRLWFAGDGLLETFHLKHSISSLQAKNDKAAQDNIKIKTEIVSLKKGGTAIENRARSDLGMVKKGEIFYQVVK